MPRRNDHNRTSRLGYLSNYSHIINICLCEDTLVCILAVRRTLFQLQCTFFTNVYVISCIKVLAWIFDCNGIVWRVCLKHWLTNTDFYFISCSVKACHVRNNKSYLYLYAFVCYIFRHDSTKMYSTNSLRFRSCG